AAVSVCVTAQDSRVSSVAACACPAEFDSLKDAFAEGEPIIEHFRGIGIIRDRDFPHSDEEWLDNFSLVSPLKYVSGIAPRPLLLLHGSQDEVVDVSHAYRLYAQADEPKEIVVIDGAGHRLRRDERAVAVIIDWLKARHRIPG
ncbi:MAG: prolyl oligopeptidase family serine peptidase, partial [Dehalococcoidia bacterium]|nr:prolyl oligopeptidase family serine peptidase [Dehalococcoidia bacterium]